MMVEYDDKSPVVGEGCFVAGSAEVIGDVRIGSGSSVWFGAVVRGDEGEIRIGERTNVQDLSVLHLDGTHDLTIGDDVTIGHRAIVHGCTVGDRVLIGMGAIVMNGARIGDDCIIGAGALVTEDVEVPPRSMVIGVPGRVKREVTDEELRGIRYSAGHYNEQARRYLKPSAGV